MKEYNSNPTKEINSNLLKDLENIGCEITDDTITINISLEALDSAYETTPEFTNNFLRFLEMIRVESDEYLGTYSGRLDVSKPNYNNKPSSKYSPYLGWQALCDLWKNRSKLINRN